jgi:hypothetical protein
MNDVPREHDDVTEPGTPITDSVRQGQEIHRYVGCECADVSFPIELQPNTQIDSVETQFFGTPSINIEEYTGEKYCITVTQRVRIRLMVTVGVSAKPGEGYVALCADTDSHHF